MLAQVGALLFELLLGPELQQRVHDFWTCCSAVLLQVLTMLVSRQSLSPDLRLRQRTCARTPASRETRSIGPHTCYRITCKHERPLSGDPGMRNQSTESLVGTCTHAHHEPRREELTTTPDHGRSAPLMRDVCAAAVTAAHPTQPQLLACVPLVKRCAMPVACEPLMVGDARLCCEPHAGDNPGRE